MLEILIIVVLDKFVNTNSKYTYSNINWVKEMGNGCYGYKCL